MSKILEIKIVVRVDKKLESDNIVVVPDDVVDGFTVTRQSGPPITEEFQFGKLITYTVCEINH